MSATDDILNQFGDDIAMADEIERLRNERDGLKSDIKRWFEAWNTVSNIRDLLIAERDAARKALYALGTAARAASDMLYRLRLSEGVQSWHEDWLDEIDATIAAVENAPARGDVDPETLAVLKETKNDLDA